MEVNVAINIKVETLFRGANVFRDGGVEISTRGGNISSWGEEIFPSPGDFVMGGLYFVTPPESIFYHPLLKGSSP